MSMRPEAPPPPEYAFGYRQRPESGNAINGLGETAFRRARHVFHDARGEPIAWKALDRFFSFINPFGVVRHMLWNTWQLRRQEGPVAPVKTPLGPETVKAKARSLGADLVGITRVTDEAVFEGESPPHEWAISIGLGMDRDEMVHVPQKRAAIEVMRTYRRVSRVAIGLAEYLRAHGHAAKAYGNPNSTEILHIPLAVAAGLGELGKHGSLITQELGSNVRLATVLTDLELTMDAPVDLAVDDLCTSCRRCVLDCPPDAIFDEKQWVRGTKRWYVDFDRCVPYFVKTFGCAICIEVCPWSEPGRGPSLSEHLLQRRARPSEAQEPEAKRSS